VVGKHNADIADTLQLRDVAMATIFVFLYMGCTLATPGEYDWTVLCGGDTALCQITLATFCVPESPNVCY